MIKKHIVATAAISSVIFLAGCELFRNLPEEVFYFRFQRISEDAMSPGIYRVSSKQPGTCSLYPLRLEDVARAVQKIGGERGFGYVNDCSTLYTVGNSAQTLRDEPLIRFGVEEIGTDGVQIYGNRARVGGETIYICTI